MKPIDILLIEDNPGDIELIKLAMEESKIRNHLDIVNDGAEALKYLFNEDQYKSATRPDLILLDLNLPKVNGMEVLAKIKENENLKAIPVVVLTTSQADEDVLSSYKLQANCYVTKPLGLDAFVKVVNNIENFWVSIVTLPTQD